MNRIEQQCWKSFIKFELRTNETSYLWNWLEKCSKLYYIPVRKVVIKHWNENRIQDELNWTRNNKVGESNVARFNWICNLKCMRNRIVSGWLWHKFNKQYRLQRTLLHREMEYWRMRALRVFFWRFFVTFFKFHDTILAWRGKECWSIWVILSINSGNTDIFALRTLGGWVWVVNWVGSELIKWLGE